MDQLTETEAAHLALALVAVATASVDGGTDARHESDRGLVELIEEMCDVPLTERQATVIETLGAASAALTAGLASAVAETQSRDVHVVLRMAARAIMDNHPDVA